MKQEFIPYEQALAMKELGFKEPCFFAFDNCSTPMRCTDLRTNEQKFNGVNYNSSSYTSQPTFSQAFRWFGKQFGLYSWIKMEYEYNRFIPTYYIRGIMQDDIAGGEFKTPEKAELACLKKLIEIVKNK